MTITNNLISTLKETVNERKTYEFELEMIKASEPNTVEVRVLKRSLKRRIKHLRSEGISLASDLVGLGVSEFELGEAITSVKL